MVLLQEVEDGMTLKEPSLEYENFKIRLDEKDKIIHTLWLKLEKYDNEGCPRCQEKDKEIERLTGQILDLHRSIHPVHKDREDYVDTG